MMEMWKCWYWKTNKEYSLIYLDTVLIYFVILPLLGGNVMADLGTIESKTLFMSQKHIITELTVQDHYSTSKLTSECGMWWWYLVVDIQYTNLLLYKYIAGQRTVSSQIEMFSLIEPVTWPTFNRRAVITIKFS